MKTFFPLIFCLIISHQCLSQENSLLWEITGNGLESPSYIYGTMHVSKKVAFRLDDVFYDALNKSECIALESEPTEWLKHLHEDFGYRNNRPNSYYYRDNFYADLFKLEPISPFYLRGVIKFDNYLINSYLYRKDSRSDNFEEETYLDMFIYQAGKKNKKLVIGLEDFEESRYLTTKARYNPNKRKPDEWYTKYLKNKNRYSIQEDVYRDRNVELLDSLGAAVNTDFFREHMLFKRNENMVKVLEKQMHKMSVFSGVGAAHLGGERGMLNLLRERGYTVKPLTSDQTSYAEKEKNKLENLFTAPTLTHHTTSDGFISLKSFDSLREFSAKGIKYYIAPDMTNGAYLSVNRLNTFEYLPNDQERVDLDFIKNLLYEDIPGTIIEKHEFETPFPGISILNKTKKGDYQKYHIYKTPLEIIVIKLGGKKDFVLKYEAEIFNSITFKKATNNIVTFKEKHNKYSFNVPDNYVTDNMEYSGKKLVQSIQDDNHYFFQEAVLHDIEYIEEDAFEAKYIHKSFYKELEIEELKGTYSKGDYSSYQSSAQLDSLSDKKIWLKSIVKDGSYYLLGFVGKTKAKAQSYFDSFKLQNTNYENIKKVRDTSLHFTVNSPIKAPQAYRRSRYKSKKEYDEDIRRTAYTTAANEKIFITRTKFHDLDMVENIDSLWNGLVDTYYWESLDFDFSGLKRDKLNVTDEKRFSKNNLNYFTYKLKDSASSKFINVQYVHKQGVLYKLSTLQDSISKSSNFITDFYDSFTPMDTLLGKDILKDKTAKFFSALKENDSLVLSGYMSIPLTKKHSTQIIDVLKNHEFEDDRKMIQNFLLKQLISNDSSERITRFITAEYAKSYSNPVIQKIILQELFKRNKKEDLELMLSLMNSDLPLGEKTPSFNFYSKKSKDFKETKLLFPELLDFLTIEEYKKPVYKLLTRLLDSSLIKPKVYKPYRKQIISDAKTQIKRNLSKSKSYSYRYVSDYTLDNYTKLLFPLRDNKQVKTFYSRLLESKDWEALTTYYCLLKKENLIIPNKLKSKLITSLPSQHLLINKLIEKDILTNEVDTIDIKTYAKSRLFGKSNFESSKDSLSFHLEKKFTTDAGEPITLLIFKRKKVRKYNDAEYLHYIAFKDNMKERYPVKPYYISPKNGDTVSYYKKEEEMIENIINQITYKTRKRINTKRNGLF